MIKNGHYKQNFLLVKFGPQNYPASGYGNILFPNFFTCSVTPCMLTMTLLPERTMVHVQHLPQNRL